MTLASALALVQGFGAQSGVCAFPNLRGTRQDFAREVAARLSSPWLLDQGSSSLCGASVFLYSVIRKMPETFARYAIGLYETGVGKIGHLVVKPGSDCRNYVPTGIAEVDWVVLASLRDSSNALLDYDSTAVEAGGITIPSTVAGWFRSAGFTQVENRTNLFFDSDLHTLLKADQRRGAGASVCLFIGADLLNGGDSGTVIPDHWVRLASPIIVDGKPSSALLSRGTSINNDDKLAKATISFDVFSWGDPHRPVTRMRPGLTVETCIDYFYGFVAAK